MRLPTIDRRALDAVTGGRITHVDQLSPDAIKAINGLAQAVDGLKQVKQQSAEQDQGFKQQAFQKLIEMKQGGGRGSKDG